MRLEKSSEKTPNNKKKLGSLIILIFLMFILINILFIIYYNFGLYTPPHYHFKLLYYKDLKINEESQEIYQKNNLNLEFNSIHKIKTYQKMLKTNPTLWYVYIDLARIFDALGYFKEAEENYKKVYIYKKDSIEYTLEIIDFMIKIKKFEEALFYISKLEKNMDNPEIAIRLFFIYKKKNNLLSSRKYLEIYRLWVETASICHIKKDEIYKFTYYLLEAEEKELAIQTLASKLNFEIKNQIYDINLIVFSLDILLKLNQFDLIEKILEKINASNEIDNFSSYLKYYQLILMVIQGTETDNSFQNEFLDMYYKGELEYVQKIELAIILYEKQRIELAVKILKKIIPKIKLDFTNFYIKKLYIKANYIMAKYYADSNEIFESAYITYKSILTGYYNDEIIILFIKSLIRKELYSKSKKVINTIISNTSIEIKQKNYIEILYLLALTELRLKNYERSYYLINKLKSYNYNPILLDKLKIELAKTF